MTIREKLESLECASYEEWRRVLLDDELTRDIVELQEGVPQGLRWHPEFDLLKHIFLVFTSLTRQGMPELYEAALLHDIGKVTTTNVGRDRIYSFGHDKASVAMLAAYENRLADPELTCIVIDKHMQYFEISDSRIANNLYAKEFCKADKVMGEPLFYEFFFEEAEENAEKERMVYNRQENSNKTIYVMVGISGSGKSTYIRKNFDPSVVVCPDEIRREINGDVSSQKNGSLVWKTAKERLLAILEKGNVAILDATNVNRFRRIKFMAAFNGVRKVAVVFYTELEDGIARVMADIDAGVDRSNVPEKVIRKQFSNFWRGYDSLYHEFNEVVEII